MRRLTVVDAMLLVTVMLWGLNFTVMKYVVTHGFAPVAFLVLRFGSGGLIFAGIAYAREGSLRMHRSSAKLLLGCALFGVVINQLCAVYALRFTTASTVALVIGTMPIFAALAAWALRVESMPPVFWLAALVSLGGVALIAASNAGGFSADLRGVLLALGISFSWAVYSVCIAGLMRDYSPYRVSADVLLLGFVGLAAIGAHQLSQQSFDLPALVWLGAAYVVLGPLVITNVLWYKAVAEVGPSRAVLFANLQPFTGVLFALILLGERLDLAEVIGGLAIAAGIVLERRARAAASAVSPAE